MAMCGWCGSEMSTGRSCTVAALHVDGQPVELGRYGSELGRAHRRGSRCGDCGVEWGGFHHLGCDLQQCPCCRRQMLSCGCRFDEDDPDDDPWDGSLTPLGVDANGNLMERGTLGGVEVIIHRADLPESDLTTVDGIPCTTALRTVIDIAPEEDPDHLRVIVVDLLGRGLFTEEEAWERLGQPDMAAHVGAEPVRRVLRSLH